MCKWIYIATHTFHQYKTASDETYYKQMMLDKDSRDDCVTLVIMDDFYLSHYSFIGTKHYMGHDKRVQTQVLQLVVVVVSEKLQFNAAVSCEVAP